MSIHFDYIDTNFTQSPRSQPSSSGWTAIPHSTSVWRITRDTEVEFADGTTALWAIDPTIGFHEIDLSVLKHRPVRMRQPEVHAAVAEQRTRTRDFLPF